MLRLHWEAPAAANGATPSERDDQFDKERMARTVQGANNRITQIRASYKHHTMTPEQRREADKGDDVRDSMIADMEEKYHQGIVTLEALNRFKSSMKMIHALKESIPLEKYADEPEPSATWTFDHSEYGKITITDEGSKHWRPAREDDYGSIVLINDYTSNIFGEFDDVEEVPNEEFPDDESHTTAIVYTQNGEQWISGYSLGSVFENMWIVPEQVLCGVKNEAPPGSFFSGKSIPNSDEWSPAPDGKVWYVHPNPNIEAAWVSDFNYFAAKQISDSGAFGGWSEDQVLVHMMMLYERLGRFEYWCPVKCKFMCQGEMMRQQHWFRNGDGSAQQRRYYSQNEMLDQHGGLSALPLGFREDGHPKTATDADDDDDDDVKVAAVRTVGSAVNEKFKAASKTGSVIDLS